MRIVSAAKLSCIVLSVISLALLSGCSGKEQLSSTRAYRDEIVSYGVIDGPDTVIDPSGDIDREKELREEVLNAFEILNDEREKQGLSPLMWNMELETGAGYRAREIATAFDNDHTRPDGSKWFTAAPDDALGENIYCGSMTASEAMAAWLNNPPDRENFMAPDFTKCAIAIYENDDGRFYWAAMFGKDSSQAAAETETDAHKTFLDYAGSELGLAKSLTGNYTRTPSGEWGYTSKYPPEVFGSFECSIQDLDGDGEDEMLVVSLAGRGEDSSLNLSVYEDDIDIALMDLFIGADEVLSSDHGDTYVFSYNDDGTPVIGMMTYNTMYPGADGAYLNFFALTYDGSAFDVSTHAQYAGSDMEDTDFAKQMRKSGINVEWEDIISEHSQKSILDAASGTLIAEVITKSDDTGYDENYDPAPISGRIELHTYSGNDLVEGGKSSAKNTSKKKEKGSVKCFEIEENESAKITVDLDGDGSEETVKFKMIADENEWIERVNVLAGEDKITIKDGLDGYAGSGLKCAWFTTSDGQYLYMQWDLDNGYEGTSVYKYENGKLSFVGECGCIFFTMSDLTYAGGEPMDVKPQDPGEFYVGGFEQKLGTQWVSAKCRLGVDGMPERIGEFKYYDYNPDSPIRAKFDIPAMAVNDNGDNVMTTEIEKGDRIILFRTDGENYIDVFVDGKDDVAFGIFRINIGEDENGRYCISGNYGFKSNLLIDLFDNLSFPG